MDDRKHERVIYETIKKEIEQHGEIISLEPIDQLSARINFIQNDEDDQWSEDLYDLVQKYKEAQIVAWASLKISQEYVKDTSFRYGYVAISFNPTFHAPTHIMNMYWLGSEHTQGFTFN